MGSTGAPAFAVAARLRATPALGPIKKVQIGKILRLRTPKASNAEKTMAEEHAAEAVTERLA